MITGMTVTATGVVTTTIIIIAMVATVVGIRADATVTGISIWALATIGVAGASVTAQATEADGMIDTAMAIGMAHSMTSLVTGR